jgi:hypothetical protein
MGDLLSGPEIKTGPMNKAFAQGIQAAKKLKPVGLDAGGLTSTFAKNSISINASPERAGLVGSIADRFLEQAGLTAGLRAKVAPGFSDLRASRLQEIENARRASISNLRDNLARRRVLGSSFGADAETRAEIEFAQQKERVQAESFLQEIDLTNKFIAQEFDLTRQAFGTKLGELNLQADLAAGLTAQATETLKASAQLQAQLAMQSATTNAQLGIAQAGLDAQAQAGVGSLIGKVAGIALAPATGGLSLAALGA